MMTYLEYMQDHRGENMSWCRPYLGENNAAIVINEGEVIYSTCPNDMDLDEALDRMHEAGCADCPMACRCCIMLEECGKE